MATLIAPDCVRYTVNSVYNSRPSANIIDMVVLDAGGIGPETRDDFVVDVAGVILRAWTGRIRALQNVSVSNLSVSWVDLNDENGSVGEISSSEGVTWPQPGLVTGQGLPANVAMLVQKRTTNRRQSRPGRLFLGGLSESQTDGSYIGSAIVTAAQAAWSGFLEDITETSVLDDAQYFPTVIHTVNEGTAANPSIVYTGNTQVTNMVPQALLATQRRRLRK